MQLTYRCGARSLALTVRREAPGRYAVAVDGTLHGVDVTLIDRTTLHLAVNGHARLVHVVRENDVFCVWIDGDVYRLAPDTGAGAEQAALLAPLRIVAPMPGKVLQVLVQAGQSVAADDGLVIVEAMKMEHRITAAAPATVRAVHVAVGEMVDGGALLVELEYAGGA